MYMYPVVLDMYIFNESELSFNRWVLNTYYVPAATVLGPRSAVMNRA